MTDSDYQPMIAVDKLLEQAATATHDLNTILLRLGFVERVDEVAILCRNEQWLDRLVMEAVRHPAVTHFNGADDHVWTEPIKACYSTRYEFFDVVGAAYRLEVMALRHGFSPLHYAIATDAGPDFTLGFIHASFKCQTEEEYGYAVLRLREAGWEDAQRCTSDYGTFSYWTPMDIEHWIPKERFVFLKPRVNLRDQP